VYTRGTVFLMKIKRSTMLFSVISALYIGSIGTLLVASLREHRFMTERVLVQSGFANTLLMVYLLLAVGYTLLVFSKFTITSKTAVACAAIVTVLALGAWPIISLDAASYLTAVKNIVVYGVNPMREAFSAVPQNPWSASIAMVHWYVFPVPYGPIFFLLILPLGAIFHLVVAVYGLKLLVALAWFVVVYLIWKKLFLAEKNGRRLLLILLNPLVVLFLLVDAHNEVFLLLFTLLGLLSINAGKLGRGYGALLLGVLTKVSGVVMWPIGWFEKGTLRIRRVVWSVFIGGGLFLGINYFFGHTVASFQTSYSVMGGNCLYICSPMVLHLSHLHIPLLLSASVLWIYVMWRYLYSGWEPFRFAVWSYLILFGVATTWFAPWYLITPAVLALTINDRKYTILAWLVTFIGLLVAATGLA